jgi:hypothetical protein
VGGQEHDRPKSQNQALYKQYILLFMDSWWGFYLLEDNLFVIVDPLVYQIKLFGMKTNLIGKAAIFIGVS